MRDSDRSGLLEYYNRRKYDLRRRDQDKTKFRASDFPPDAQAIGILALLSLPIWIVPVSIHLGCKRVGLEKKLRGEVRDANQEGYPVDLKEVRQAHKDFRVPVEEDIWYDIKGFFDYMASIPDEITPYIAWKAHSFGNHDHWMVRGAAEGILDLYGAGLEDIA